ncbi:unnamed protein product [Caenorhabditis auriculariae]|uniref:Uncharacterized protein n=1 Tax=Caenorhabditis auriculariae TaxID=2777116 RepID=A0A8S1H236_9PELO|nr:unnamed protein product [Caenorhabditis auriculariae]
MLNTREDYNNFYANTPKNSYAFAASQDKMSNVYTVDNEVSRTRGSVYSNESMIESRKNARQSNCRRALLITLGVSLLILVTVGFILTSSALMRSRSS